MQPHPKADPAIYPKVRELALTPKPGGQKVLMDWNVGNGNCSVLAASDGTASLYLSSGGGYIGGAQKYPSIREAALNAVRLANALSTRFGATGDKSLPPRGEIYFYLTTGDGVYRAMATDAGLKDGSDPLVGLGSAMQRVVTEYRLRYMTPPVIN